MEKLNMAELKREIRAESLFDENCDCIVTTRGSHEKLMSKNKFVEVVLKIFADCLEE